MQTAQGAGVKNAGAPSSSHPDELLPWYANGTLAEPERNAVAAHLAGCERCRAELAFLEGLRARIAEMGPVEGSGEFGLHRLLRDVRARPRSLARPARWQAAALAAALAVIVVQSTFLLQRAAAPESIAPLGEAARAGTVLQIRFAPHATEKDMREALRSVGARLVDGPGALGIYRVRLLTDAQGKAMPLEQALAVLAARRAVVEQVLPESGPERRAE